MVARHFLIFLVLIYAIPSGAQNDQKQSNNAVHDFSTLPKLKWKHPTNAPIISSPLVDDGRLYLGGLDSTFYCLELVSGKLIWKMKTSGEIRSTACSDTKYIFFLSGDGKAYSVDKRSGKIKWTFATKGERKYDFADYYHSSPVIDSGILYFGSGDGNIYALNATSGQKIWHFSTGDVVHATPAINGKGLFIGSFDGYFYSMDKYSGKLIWRFKSVGHKFFSKGEMMGSPTLYKNLVIVGSRDYNLYAIDQEKGYCHWNKQFPKGWALANIVHDSVLYTGTSDDRLLIAADPISGKEYWKTNLKFNIFGSCAFTNYRAYVGTLMGKVYAVDLAKGEFEWVFNTDGYNKSHLNYFKPDDTFRDDIFTKVKSNEEFIAVEYELGAIFSTPTISNDHLVVTSTDGNVYCFVL